MPRKCFQCIDTTISAEVEVPHVTTWSIKKNLVNNGKIITPIIKIDDDKRLDTIVSAVTSYRNAKLSKETLLPQDANIKNSQGGLKYL